MAISNLKALIPFPLPIDTAHDYILKEVDLVTLEARVEPQRYLFDDYDLAGNPFIATLGIAFYTIIPRLRSNPEFAIESIVRHEGIVKLLESGASSMASDLGQIHISMTALSSEILQKNRISWRMSKTLYAKMVDEGWKMLVFRTENGVTRESVSVGYRCHSLIYTLIQSQNQSMLVIGLRSCHNKSLCLSVNLSGTARPWEVFT